MADLVVQSGDLYHDADAVVLTTSVTTLVLQDLFWPNPVQYKVDHFHYADSLLLGPYKVGLVVSSCEHDHVANHIYSLTESPSLTVNEAAHAHVVGGDLYLVSDEYVLWTDPLSPPKLPTMECEAQCGVRINMPEGGLYLPGIAVEARAGSRAEGNLPIMEISAAGTHTTHMSVDGVVPVPSLSARTGVRGGTMRLPTIGISAVSRYFSATLDRRLPGITVSASAYGDNTASLDVSLPALQIAMSMLGDMNMSLDANVPPPRLTATGYTERTMSLSGLLPAIEATASGGNNSMTLYANLPPPVMAAVTGEGPGGGVIQDASRYDDYVLRYSR
jgi:hypothetical protein